MTFSWAADSAEGRLPVQAEATQRSAKAGATPTMKRAISSLPGRAARYRRHKCWRREPECLGIEGWRRFDLAQTVSFSPAWRRGAGSFSDEHERERVKRPAPFDEPRILKAEGVLLRDKEVADGDVVAAGAAQPGRISRVPDLALRQRQETLPLSGTPLLSRRCAPSSKTMHPSPAHSQWWQPLTNGKRPLTR